MKLRSRSSVNWRAAVAGDRVDEEKKPVIIIAFPFFSSSAPIVHVQFLELSKNDRVYLIIEAFTENQINVSISYYTVWYTYTFLDNVREAVVHLS